MLVSSFSFNLAQDGRMCVCRVSSPLQGVVQTKPWPVSVEKPAVLFLLMDCSSGMLSLPVPYLLWSLPEKVLGLLSK